MSFFCSVGFLKVKKKDFALKKNSCMMNNKKTLIKNEVFFHCEDGDMSWKKIHFV